MFGVFHEIRQIRRIYNLDGSPLPGIILFIICLLGSMVCSAVETAFTAVGRAKMMSLADGEDRRVSKRAGRVIYVLDRFDAALSANLICNNVFNIGCANAATLIAIGLGGGVAVVIATALTTLIVFFSAEMLPKRFAKDCPEFVAMNTASAVIFAVKALRPFVAVFTAMTNALTRLFLGRSGRSVTYTEHEVESLVDAVAADTEASAPEHGSLIRSAYEFTALPVSDIETSWKNTVKLPLDADRDTIVSIARSVQHSRFPVIDADGAPAGVLYIRSYLRSCIKGQSADVRELMWRPHYIDADTPADHALADMSKNKTSLSFVRRADGVVTGIVTVEDIIEYLVGDMDDETDAEENV